MPILKKLIFAPILLIVFGLLIYQLNPLFNSYDLIFSLSISSLIQLIIISFLLIVSGLLFCIFATLANDWKLILPVALLVALLAALMPLLFLNPALGLILAVIIFASLLLCFLFLDSALKSYLNFQPAALLGPTIKRLTGLLILAICVVYFLSVNKTIAQNGFQIPDSLIDTALNMTPQAELDPKILAPADLMKDTIKQTVKDQVQGIIDPYLSFIPAILALLLFLTLQSLTSILSIIISPLLWLIFLILEKSGVTRYETTTREVKKLVV